MVVLARETNSWSLLRAQRGRYEEAEVGERMRSQGYLEAKLEEYR